MFFQEKKQIVILCLAGAMIGGFVLFRYLPLRKRAKMLKSQRSTAQLAIAKASSEKEQLPVLREHLDKLQITVGHYETKIPVQPALGGFLGKIADLMNEHGLKEQLVQPGKEVETETLKCIPISMKCKGGLKQIFEFFKRIQALDRSIRIEQVKLENEKEFNGEVRMQTEAVIYYGLELG